MKIKAKQEIEVEISEVQQHLVALNYLCKIFDWEEDYFIVNEKVFQRITNYGSHSFDQNNLIRSATKKDKEIYSVIKTLKNNLKI
jgi:hypothetical protein